MTVRVTVAAGTDVTVSPESLTFTADTWSSAQRVTVRAAEDADALADAEVAVRHAVSGYGEVTAAADVAVTIAENDTEGVAVSAGALRVPEGGSGSYTVVLESDAGRGERRVTVRRVTVRAAEDADGNGR